MGTYFQNLCERLQTLLAHHSAFASNEALYTAFADPRLCGWQCDLPQVRSREQRIVETIHYLRHCYNVDQENGLVVLLQVLGEQIMPDDDFQWLLSDMAKRVASAIRQDSDQWFNTALQGIEEFEPLTPIPYAGQVIAGTGDVVMTYIDALTPGESYYLDVIGTSMEHEGIFEGDRIEMRVFNSSEWPNEGDMIVTKYLPDGAEPEMATDFVGMDLQGPTLKIFHQGANGEFHLGWRKDNTPWTSAPWKRLAVPGNPQTIVTRYLVPIGKVIDTKTRREWNFAVMSPPRILGMGITRSGGALPHKADSER
ncbi:MAG TPA: hypothetical protein PLH19_04065 [Anaerolineae bacterium]|nr:hypothetical protein [Anaerolineae bacterium]HQH37696.1 hypothetical protein [Anaerolineae bacterium]